MVWSWPVDVNYHEADEGPGFWGFRFLAEGLGFTAVGSL